MKTLDEALDEHCKQVFNEKKSSEFVNQAQISFTKGSLFGFESGVKHTKEEYEEKLRWIPVEEKLPEIREYSYQIVVKTKSSDRGSNLYRTVAIFSFETESIIERKIRGYIGWRYFL